MFVGFTRLLNTKLACWPVTTREFRCGMISLLGVLNTRSLASSEGCVDWATSNLSTAIYGKLKSSYCLSSRLHYSTIRSRFPLPTFYYSLGNRVMSSPQRNQGSRRITNGVEDGGAVTCVANFTRDTQGTLPHIRTYIYIRIYICNFYCLAHFTLNTDGRMRADFLASYPTTVHNFRTHEYGTCSCANSSKR